MRSFAGSRSGTKATMQAAKPADRQATRQWSGQDAGLPGTANATHSMADVLQRNHKKKKKNQQNVSAAELRERERQSKAARNVNNAIRYGDSGRREDVQQIVRQQGLQGQTIAHGRGNSTSGTSGKYQTVVKKAVKQANKSRKK